MKRKTASFAVLTLAALLLCGCAGNKAPDEMPPDTDLEFWICDNVDGVDFSGYAEKYGMFGGREYYGTGYVPEEDESGAQTAPEHCVIYTVTSYPDYSDKEQHITRITVTDPAVRVFGLTAESSPDEFRAALESRGYSVKETDAEIFRAEKDGVAFVRGGGEIRIIAEVSNKKGLVF